MDSSCALSLKYLGKPDPSVDIIDAHIEGGVGDDLNIENSVHRDNGSNIPINSVHFCETYQGGCGFPRMSLTRPLLHFNPMTATISDSRSLRNNLDLLIG